MCDNEYQYERIVLYKDEFFEAVLIIWKPGQKSRIHSHSGSYEMVRVISGEIFEEIFEEGFEDSMEIPLQRVVHKIGEVTHGKPDLIHRVGNTLENINSVTLHVYTPPFSQMTYYD